MFSSPPTEPLVALVIGQFLERAQKVVITILIFLTRKPKLRKITDL